MKNIDHQIIVSLYRKEISSLEDELETSKRSLRNAWRDNQMKSKRRSVKDASNNLKSVQKSFERFKKNK